MSFWTPEVEKALRETIVVIPSINGRKLLEQFFPTLDIPTQQVVVIDQNSSDGTEEYCRERGAHCLQLGKQASFTQACNAGFRWALERDAQYICLANNDIEFLTPVLHQLHHTLRTESQVAAVAPTQVIKCAEGEFLAYRVMWDLTVPNFQHDFTRPVQQPEILEAEFCEFTCVLLPSAVLREIGFLDDDFGFYHEDADFCYRLFRQGYRCVYNQQAQIVHHKSTTVDKTLPRKMEFLNRNKRRFVEKHLHYGTNCPPPLSTAHTSWEIITDHMSRYQRRYGLLDENRPLLCITHPGSDPRPYLFTVWETTQLPPSWLDSLSRYEHIFVMSQWVADVFRVAGCSDPKVLRLGVEPDVYHPHGDKFDFNSEKTFLNICHNQHRKGLDVLVKAWLQVKNQMPLAQLCLCGYDIDLSRWLGKPSKEFWYGKFKYRHFQDQRITVLCPRVPLDYDEMSALYRGAHAYVLSSRSEGFGLPVIEAMSCGTLSIVPNYSATAEFVRDDHCLSFGGLPHEANYSDKGFQNVGSWWEPSQKELQNCLLRAYFMDEAERSHMTHRARQFVLNEYTWRRVMLNLVDILAEIQEPRPRQLAALLDAAGPTPASLTYQNMRRYLSHRLLALGRKIDRLGRILEHDGVGAASQGAARLLARQLKRRLWRQS
ncbi:MAG: glycosyltransferase [Gemmataceae bacterium]